MCSARWIGNHGFSIGIDDVQPGEYLNQQKKKKIDEGYRECHEHISSYSKGQLTCEPGYNAAQTLELKITSVLNQIRTTAGNVCGCFFPSSAKANYNLLVPITCCHLNIVYMFFVCCFFFGDYFLQIVFFQREQDYSFTHKDRQNTHTETCVFVHVCAWRVLVCVYVCMRAHTYVCL